MGWARLLACVVFALMTALMANILVHDSFMTGLGMDRFIAGLKDPWQTFIGFDMMSGLIFMFGWIIYRQQGARIAETICWVLLGNWWGNIVIAAYILVALRQSGGEAEKFFMGSRKGALLPVWAPGFPMRLVCFVGAAAKVVYILWSMNALGFSGLPAWAFVPAFGPVVLAFMLLGRKRPA